MLTFEQVTRNAQAGDAEAQELLAEVLQQQGRPADAAGWMQRAALAGRASALARLGLWRLVGVGMPQAPAQAVAEILRAAGDGDPLGLSLAATVTAGGVGAPADLPAAVGWLVRAGKAGHARALAQLAVLLGPQERALSDQLKALAASPEQGARPLDLDEGRVLAGIDLSPFFRPIAAQLARPSPRIVLLPDLLTPALCDYVIALAAPVLTRGKVMLEDGGEGVRAERSNSVMNFGLADSDVVLELINERLATAAGLPARNAEGLGVLHYAPGEQYAPHVDYVAETLANSDQLAQRGQRVRTLLVYLNDDFEGGATEFLRLDIKFKPPRGWGLMFDNVTAEGAMDPLTLHRGAPPERGQKWLISKWFRTKALRPGPEGGTA
jgi:prolyl 4-hydroxylase